MCHKLIVVRVVGFQCNINNVSRVKTHVKLDELLNDYSWMKANDHNSSVKLILVFYIDNNIRNYINIC